VSRPRFEFPVHFGRQRRGSRHEQPNVPADVLREQGTRQQPMVIGRHTHEDGRARKRPEHIGCIELASKQQTRAAYQGNVERDEEAVAVKDRQGMKEDIEPREAPEFTQGLRGIR
jgi:hypothetical protein